MHNRLYNSRGDKIFRCINYVVLTLLTLSCFLPILHVLAVSFSDNVSATANQVLFIPKGFNFAAYETMFDNSAFLSSFMVSVFRTVVGTAINLVFTILAAYPLSKENDELRGRKWISVYFIIPMMISGGMIPMYLLVSRLGMIDSIWSLIIPTCLPIGNMVLMMNFFRGINKSILEAAYIDGAGEFSILLRVVLPLSTASIATVTLFQMVAHWNEWFAATIYINDSRKWPLQTLLRQMLKSIDISTFGAESISKLRLLSDRSFRGAMIIFSTIPILCVYPFMQKYFVTGITIGSVKE